MDSPAKKDFLLRLFNISQIARISNKKELFKTKENLNDVLYNNKIKK